MDWRKVWVVARHEFLTNIRRAGFIIMTLFFPAMGILTLLIGALFAGQAMQVLESIGEQFDIGSEPIGVVDESGLFTPILTQYQDDFLLYKTEEAAEEEVVEETSEDVVEDDDDFDSLLEGLEDEL